VFPLPSQGITTSTVLARSRHRIPPPDRTSGTQVFACLGERMAGPVSSLPQLASTGP